MAPRSMTAPVSGRIATAAKSASREVKISFVYNGGNATAAVACQEKSSGQKDQEVRAPKAIDNAIVNYVRIVAAGRSAVV
jgi:hypothetical protein